jgi:anti-sigma factor RsiW
MKACPDHKETLWLDVFGELEPHERPAWEKHLEACESCRREREQLAIVLQRVRASMPSPALSREEADAFASTIARKLKQEREQTWWRKRPFGMPHRFIPAFAAACVLIVALGWFGMKDLRGHFSMKSISHLNSGKQVLPGDLDVVKNLELLEEMDTLHKLVQMVDHGNRPSTTKQN